jgi:hypothetical protein
MGCGKQECVAEGSLLRASLPASKQRAIPHPALRATFPSKLGKECARLEA